MNSLEAYKKIIHLDLKIFSTNDISILLKISNKSSYKILYKLNQQKLIIHLKRNLWTSDLNIEPLSLPDYLTAPMSSYISLQSALYFHGMISQIPRVVYSISIARTQKFKTPIADYSIHQITPNLFMGFSILKNTDIKMASKEKALFDFYYLKSVKSRLFYSLPELYMPENFNWNIVESYIEKIKNISRKSMVKKSLNILK